LKFTQNFFWGNPKFPGKLNLGILMAVRPSQISPEGKNFGGIFHNFVGTTLGGFGIKGIHWEKRVNWGGPHLGHIAVTKGVIPTLGIPKGF